MKHIFFTPGPSELFPTVEMHIQHGLAASIPSISHRGKQFEELFQATVFSLRTFLTIPNDYHIFFVSSGTEAMERAIENTVEKYSFHFVNGSFSKRFFTIAEELGKQPEKYEVESGEGFSDWFRNNDNILRSASDDNLLKNSELICLTQNETSTGVAIPLDFIYQLKEQYSEKLFAVDIVSSVPYVDLDYKKLDIIFFSVQKAFGLPAGLGVMIVSPRAFEKATYLREKGICVGSFHSFLSMEKYAKLHQTPETPNVFGLYLLGKVIEDMRKIGIETIRKEINKKADFLYHFFENDQRFSVFVSNLLWRSKTVIDVKVDIGSKQVIEKAKKQGMIIGSGYAALRETHIRIANFPVHSIEQMQRLIESL